MISGSQVNVPHVSETDACAKAAKVVVLHVTVFAEGAGLIWWLSHISQVGFAGVNEAAGTTEGTLRVPIRKRVTSSPR